MKYTLIIGALLATTIAFGQKKNETSAAVEYKMKYLPAMKSGDMETAKKSIISAKQFIDEAAAHPDTEANEKTLYYKGEIYLGLMSLGQMSQDKELLALSNENTLNEALIALKTAFDNGKKYKSDVEGTTYNARVMFDKAANAMYNENKFEEAAEMYSWQAKFAAVVGTLDSNAVFYSAVCSEKADKFEPAGKAYYKLAKVGYRGPVTYNLSAGAYRKAGNVDQAKAIISEGRSKYPTDRDLLLELVNINIDANDPAGAESALQAAISSDPDNKQLHYTIGTIYIEMKQNDKAEQALNKALEIDPDYTNAQYQLGAHLVSWAGDLKTEAAKLDFGDANFDVWNAQSEEVYQRAVGPLEKYIAKEPKDKAVLTILFQLHRNLGNSDKALEYKKRADAL